MPVRVSHRPAGACIATVLRAGSDEQKHLWTRARLTGCAKKGDAISQERRA